MEACKPFHSFIVNHATCEKTQYSKLVSVDIIYSVWCSVIQVYVLVKFPWLDITYLQLDVLDTSNIEDISQFLHTFSCSQARSTR